MTASKTTAHRAWLVWLFVWLVVEIVVVVLVFQAREMALREMDTPEARAQWEAWREAEPNTTDQGGVRRRPPSSPEPPTLVLLRDHFGVILGGAVFFSSLLFGTVAIVVRGALSNSATDSGASSRPKTK